MHEDKQMQQRQTERKGSNVGSGRDVKTKKKEKGMERRGEEGGGGGVLGRKEVKGEKKNVQKKNALCKWAGWKGAEQARQEGGAASRLSLSGRVQRSLSP